MDEKEYEALAKIMTDGIKQAVDNITKLTPQELEEDVKQVSLLLSRQSNSEELLNMACDLGNNPNLLNQLFKIVATNEIDLHAAKDSGDLKKEE